MNLLRQKPHIADHARLAQRSKLRIAKLGLVWAVGRAAARFASFAWDRQLVIVLHSDAVGPGGVVEPKVAVRRSDAGPEASVVDPSSRPLAGCQPISYGPELSLSSVLDTMAVVRERPLGKTQEVQRLPRRKITCSMPISQRQPRPGRHGKVLQSKTLP